MPTKEELAAEVAVLRARLAELEDDTLAGLKQELANAKEAYRANTDDPEAKERLAKASAAINQARAEQRKDRAEFPTVGGDAVRSDG